MPTATTTALVHHTRRNEIRYRTGNADEKMNGPEPSPYNGSNGSKKPLSPVDLDKLVEDAFEGERNQRVTKLFGHLYGAMRLFAPWLRP